MANEVNYRVYYFDDLSALVPLSIPYIIATSIDYFENRDPLHVILSTKFGASGNQAFNVQ